MRGHSQPIGSVTQMSRIRLGKRDNAQYPFIKDFVPLSSLNDLVFGGWDIYDDNCYQAALACGVIDKQELEPIREQLEVIKPWSAVFDPAFVKNLSGPNVKQAPNKMKLAEMLMQDMEDFKKQHGLERLVMCWCGSTEVYQEDMDHEAFQTIEGFEKALKDNLDIIPPSMIYAYAAIRMGVPFANGSPNQTIDHPAMVDLALKYNVAIAGKDFKTGQTLMKTIVAPGLKARMLGSGWMVFKQYSWQSRWRSSG